MRLGNSLTFIDPVTAEVQRTCCATSIDPYHLRFSPDMKWFVTAANRLDHVDLYHWQPAQAEPLKLVKRIGCAPRRPATCSSTAAARWSTCRCRTVDELLAIDLATQAPRWKIKVGKMPADVYLTP
jgi:hypothetical protein